MLVLHRKLIGFDIGSNKIKWIIYSNNKKKPILYDWGIETTPRGAVRYGRIINKESLKEVLSPIVEGSKVKISGAAITFSCPEMIVRTIKLPKINNRELEQVIKYEIEQYIPENYSDYIVEYKILEEYNGEEGKILKVLVAAVPTSIVQNYLKLMDDLKLQTEIIDFHGNSVNRFLTENIRELQETNYTVLDLGSLTTTLTVMEEGRTVFTRLIQNGSEEIAASIANYFDLPLDEAESYLISKGRLLVESEENIGDLEQELAVRIKPAFDYILNNVFHSLEFYSSLDGNAVEGFIPVGGGSFLKNIADYTGKYLNLKGISYLDKLPFNSLGNIDPQHMPFFTNVLGLVFHREKDINLMPENYKRLKEVRKNKRYRIIGLALILPLITTALYFPRNYIDNLKNNNVHVQEKILAKQEYEDLKKLEEDLQKNIERRNRLIQSFQANSLEWSEVLVQIGSVVPQGLALDSLSYGDELEINGHAESYSLVAQFMVNLQNMEFISEVQPLSLYGTDDLYQFNIKCLIESEGKNETDQKRE